MFVGLRGDVNDGLPRDDTMMKINSMLMTLMECIMVLSKVHTTQRGNS